MEGREGCASFGGWRAVGQSGVRRSRQRRLCEPSPRQDIGLVFSGNGR